MAHSEIAMLPMCAEFTLAKLHETEAEVVEALQESGATRHVRALQMIRLSRALLAVGMFSMFEALLQDRVGWPLPFKVLGGYLRDAGDPVLAQRFTDYKNAINVLKHGQGDSYERLLARAAELDFGVRQPDTLFDEGDVSEVAVLVDADATFVRNCAGVIEAAARVIEQREGVYL